MPIHLSVIGIFFGADLDIHKETSVRDVLNTAREAAEAGLIMNVSKFDYHDDGKAVFAFGATYKNKFQSKVLKNEYDPGEYYLADDSDAKPVRRVWQYYVSDKNGKPRINRPIAFLNDTRAVVPAGGTLTWRMVSILAGPHAAPTAGSAS